VVTSIVESQRQLGGNAYPVPLARLVELVGHEPAIARKAVAIAITMEYVISSLNLAAKAGESDASVLIAVARDAAVLATSLALLTTVLEMKGSSDMSAFDAATLSKYVGRAVARPFEAALGRLSSSTMPDGVGSVSLPKKRRLFFLREHAWLGKSDVPTRSKPAAEPSNAVDSDFAERFARAFDELNRALGEQNYVLLHDLRQQFPSVSRPDFDRALNALRRAKAFTLDSTDGRHTRLTQEQLEGGLEEAGRILVYVARRAP
jgi:hypothetical protein